jgi:Flp pilus assembly protein TadB
MTNPMIAAATPVVAATKGVHIRGASALLLLVIVILAIAGIVYAIRRSRQRKRSVRPPDNWPHGPSGGGSQDRPPWQ